jgi:CO/xanthine dehydrogenase Mo-binding subunit
VFSKALEQADLAGFAKRKKDSRKRGKLRGIAVGSYLEITAPPSAELGKIVFEADGAVNLITGTLDYGQGHATPFAQVLATELGVPFDAVRLTQGDSDIVHTGNGTGGSRSITASGTAIVEASKLVIEKGKQAAAHILEASEADIEFTGGQFTIAGTDRGIGIMELASKLRDQDAGRRTLLARCGSHHEGRSFDISQRLSCRRGRDRSRHRRCADHPLQRRQRFRHRGESDDRRRANPWWRGAGHRPGIDGMRHV